MKYKLVKQKHKTCVGCCFNKSKHIAFAECINLKNSLAPSCLWNNPDTGKSGGDKYLYIYKAMNELPKNIKTI